MTTKNPLIPSPEAAPPKDVFVCAGCGGRAFKISRNMNKKCSFCGSFKIKRNPIVPKVCSTCDRKYCKHIPGGQLTCKFKRTRSNPVSTNRLATAGKGLGHACAECEHWASLCKDKRRAALACKHFSAGAPSLLPVLHTALAQCNSSRRFTIDMQNKNRPVTLLYVSPSTAAWMKSEARKINERQGGCCVGLATIARAILTALAEAQLDLGACRGETDVNDLVRKLATATITEVKS